MSEVAGGTTVPMNREQMIAWLTLEGLVFRSCGKGPHSTRLMHVGAKPFTPRLDYSETRKEWVVSNYANWEYSMYLPLDPNEIPDDAWGALTFAVVDELMRAIR